MLYRMWESFAPSLALSPEEDAEYTEAWGVRGFTGSQLVQFGYAPHLAKRSRAAHRPSKLLAHRRSLADALAGRSRRQW